MRIKFIKMEIDKTIEEIYILAETYKAMRTFEPETLNYILKDLAVNLAYLEAIRSEVHDKHEIFINQQIAEGCSVARATNLANIRYPELYRLRCIERGFYSILGAIRTNISYLKQEKQNI